MKFAPEIGARTVSIVAVISPAEVVMTTAGCRADRHSAAFRKKTAVNSKEFFSWFGIFQV